MNLMGVIARIGFHFDQVYFNQDKGLRRILESRIR